jgi:exo-beta-1,3-glucanase (GH17 family)
VPAERGRLVAGPPGRARAMSAARRSPRRTALLLAPLLLLLLAPAGAARAAAPALRDPARAAFRVRPFRPAHAGRPIVEAIAYGPHRDGQRPGGPSPTRAEVGEDLRLMARHWHLLRLYGSVGPADSILAVIRAARIPMKVVLGIWIEPETATDSAGRVTGIAGKPEENRRELDEGVRLAAAYPGIVVALCVGNETQIAWSAHRVPEAQLVDALRAARARSSVPVTTADDFNFWNKPASRAVAAEVDFVMMHCHPLWNGRSLADAVPWTAAQYDTVRMLHRGRAVVIGETGWATAKTREGDQGKYMKAEADERSQAVFCHDFAAWARRARVVTFFFEAFDENWKGGPEPGDAEKHWGYYRADRSPKPVMTGGR